MQDESEIIVVLSTVPSREIGRELGRMLVGKRLAACVNIIPGLTSIYEWEGKLEEDSEELMVIKTTSKSLDSLISELSENHPYDVPEIIALPVKGGHSVYMDWIRSMTDSSQMREDSRP